MSSASNSATVSLAAQSPSVAVIDIGSNSIKALVARRAQPMPDDATAEPVEALFSRSINVRLSARSQWQDGLPRLAPEAMDAALHAIETLLRDCAPYSPKSLALIGTSALREAANASEFTTRVHAKTGHRIRILSGAEEAALIGRGLLCDPALQTAHAAYAFDLGGGSLECLKLHKRQVIAAISLPLGSVRLMSQCVGHPEAPLAPTERAKIRDRATQVFTESGFALDLPQNAPVISTGGLWFNVRAMLTALARSSSQDDTELAPAWIARAQIEHILETAAALPLAERLALPGIAAGRADILPVALTTMLTLLDLGQWPGLHHSTYNLRYGVAIALL